ncbi:lipoprotein [Clostridium sp. CTA-7]
MKKFLFIFVILILTMSIGCSKVSGKDTQAIKAPDNNNLKIKGVWSIEDISILDNEIENKEEIMNLKSSLISITNNKFSILNKVYSNPKYKLKVVDETYVLSYELNLKLGDVLEEESKLDLISIIDSNTIVGDFISVDDENGYIFYDGILFKLVKKESNPKDIDYENNMVEAEVIKEDYNSDIGVMIALKTPRKKLDNGTFTEEKYKTLWISFKNDKLQPVLEKENIIFPRMNGIWSIKSNLIENNAEHIEYFTAAPLEGKQEIKLEASEPKDVYKNINFISNDYISIEKYEGDNFQNIFPIYQTIPIDNINSKKGLNIEEIYSIEAKEKYKKDFNSTLDTLSEEKRNSLNKDINYSNFTIKRVEGKWSLVGNIPSINTDYNGISYRISLNPSKKILNYDTLLISWKDLKWKFPFIKDAYTSPTGRLAVILSNNKLLVYEMEDRDVKGSPLISIELNEDEEVIMAEWASGSYVDSWAKAFKDGKEIGMEEE